MQPLEAGDPRVIGEYRLLRRLGAGGMGRVYLGRSPGGRTVAVKVVHPHFAVNEEFRERFRREVQSARQVGGGWTAPVLDADPDADMPWVATGYVAGPTLQQAVADHGPLPEHAVRVLGTGLAEALTAVHGLGLVHRDIKPSNVLLTLDGPRLIDFGIARAMDGTTVLTSTGVSIGSPGYMSPEQVLGKSSVSAASDLFSLGAVLAYAATGTAPFPGDSSHALLYLVVHEEPELDGVDGPVRELIAACLAKDAAARPSPAEVVEALAGPAGASGLLRPGWLPAALVEEVSRSAVELLDLEPEGSGQPGQSGQSAESVSGLVPFTHPAQRSGPTGAGTDPGTGGAGGTGAHGTGGAAGFGPPDPSYGEAAPLVPAPHTPAPHAPPSEAEEPAARRRIALSAHANSGPPGGVHIPHPPGPPGQPPGRPPGPRGRQLSCTLVLSIAGVLAAALLVTTLVFDVLPGGGSGGDNSADPGRSPTAHPTRDPSDGGSDSADGAVPKAFTGTWRGDVATASGVPAGTLTITIKQGGKGDRIGTGKVVLSGLTCQGSWKLTSATPARLRTDATVDTAESGCTGGSDDEVFTLKEDGTLRYESNDPAGGNSAGTLKKTG